MSKRILFVIVLVMLALTVIAAPVAATKSTAVSGKAAAAGPPSSVEVQPAGNNCIVDVDTAWDFFDGDLNGIATVHMRIVSHGPCPAGPFDNFENHKVSGTFDGDLAGRSGTFDFTYEGNAWPAEPGELALASRLVILSGTGQLANLHGTIDFTYVMGDESDHYEGQIHFDP